MPVANGLAIAFKQLFVSIASLLGIKLDLGSFGQGYTDLEEDIEGVSNGFEEASNAAKKLKGQLQGFDELNVIKSQDSSGAGAAGDEPEKVPGIHDTVRIILFIKKTPARVSFYLWDSGRSRIVTGSAPTLFRAGAG